MDPDPLTPVSIQLDPHLLHRLEALQVLQAEVDPRHPLPLEEALRHAVETGLDQLLSDLLARSPRMTVPDIRHRRAGH